MHRAWKLFVQFLNVVVLIGAAPFWLFSTLLGQF